MADISPTHFGKQICIMLLLGFFFKQSIPIISLTRQNFWFQRVHQTSGPYIGVSQFLFSFFLCCFGCGRFARHQPSLLNLGVTAWFVIIIIQLRKGGSTLLHTVGYWMYNSHSHLSLKYGWFLVLKTCNGLLCSWIWHHEPSDFPEVLACSLPTSCCETPYLVTVVPAIIRLCKHASWPGPDLPSQCTFNLFPFKYQSTASHFQPSDGHQVPVHHPSTWMGHTSISPDTKPVFRENNDHPVPRSHQF